MQLRRIKLLAFLIPIAGLLLLEAIRHFVLQPALGERSPHLTEHLLSGAIVLVGVLVFSFLIFRMLERAQGQLTAVNEAARTVTSDLDLEGVLQRVAELARGVAGAAYASVQIVGEELAVASGLRPNDGSSLALPIVVKGKNLGRLELATTGRGFPERDRRALETFATEAGIAIQDARLLRQVQELAAVRERARIGADLHDGVIQKLYAVRLKAEDAADQVAEDPGTASREMREIHRTLRDVIDEMRTYAYGLRDGDGAVDLGRALEHLVGEFPRGTPTISLEPEGSLKLPGALATNILHVVREALTNAVRHADARKVRVKMTAADELVAVSVEDDGCGFDPAEPSPGLGMEDMRDRAVRSGGLIEIHSERGGGTQIRLSVPSARSY